MSIDEYQEMKQALSQSEGARLSSDLLALERSRGVFLGNCDEFLGFLNTNLNDPPTETLLWDLQDPEGFERFLAEVDRLFHNVAAAAKSLKDHSYRFRDKWLKPDERDTLREEHDERVRQAFAESRSAQLVEGLRNIVQHRELPRPLGYMEGAEGGGFRSEVHFDRDDLLKWKGWNSEIRTALKEGDVDLDLGEVITDYRAAVVDFHGWFRTAVRERNAEALEDFDRRRRELAE
jgi:hypothetical protein